MLNDLQNGEDEDSQSDAQTHLGGNKRRRGEQQKYHLQVRTVPESFRIFLKSILFGGLRRGVC